MYQGLLHAHSALRWVVLLLIIITFVKALMGWFGKQSYSGVDNKLSLFSLISTHLQFVLGIALYFKSEYVQFNSETMKNPMIRQWTVEHITIMVVAVVLVTLGRSLSKRAATDPAKFKRVALFFGFALIMIFLGIPADRWF